MTTRKKKAAAAEAAPAPPAPRPANIRDLLRLHNDGTPVEICGVRCYLSPASFDYLRRTEELEREERQRLGLALTDRLPGMVLVWNVRTVGLIGTVLRGFDPVDLGDGELLRDGRENGGALDAEACKRLLKVPEFTGGVNSWVNQRGEADNKTLEAEEGNSSRPSPGN